MKEQRKHGKRPPRAPREEVKVEWIPKTLIGKQVKSGEIADIRSLLDVGKLILEAEIIDALVPETESELLLIGQSKGKFGGGQRRVFKQTQKKTKEGNKPKFSTMAVVGNRNGIVGIGFGKAKETVPAREKSLRNAKKNVFQIKRGCGSWQCGCKSSHSIPFSVKGKVGSVEIELIPAPKGKGLVVEKECQKILALAGIQDIWSKTKGKTKSKQNLIIALELALKKLMRTKTKEDYIEQFGITQGPSGVSEQNE